MIEALQQICGMALANVAHPAFLDYVVVAIAFVAVALVCVLTVKFFIRPGERNSNHIKRRILQDEF